MPILPASAVRLPAERSRWAIMAVVVDLPLVPVTQTRRPTAGSANHRPLELVKRTPLSAASAAGDAYGLMPGDLMTIS